MHCKSAGLENLFGCTWAARLELGKEVKGSSLEVQQDVVLQFT